MALQNFKLSEDFLSPYKHKKVDWGPLGEFVFLRSYSRMIYSQNRNEKWWETVKRVVEGVINIQKEHCSKLRLPWKNNKARKSARIMYEKIFNFKFLPPGRGLWMMGTEFILEKGSAALNNCGFVSTGDIKTRGTLPFTWTMDALMLGVGIGFDTKGGGKLLIKQPKPADGLTFRIPDTREGWVNTLGLLLDAYFYGKKMPVIDYSGIRPPGKRIAGFGGVSSGSEPLKKLIDSIDSLLSKKIGEFLESTDIVDIFNMIGVCVISGNVRRSAEIAIGDHNDKSYITMKDPVKNKKELLSHRWASNNSVFAETGKTDYSDIAKSIAANGEPGIIWLENIRKYGRLIDGENYADKLAMGVNPCGEQTLESLELCCLVETFPSRHESYEEYRKTLKSAYLYAKTVTLLPTHWEETNAILMKNRRIGTSQSGIIDAFVKHGRREILNWSDEGYQYLRNLDEIYSNWLCVPKSIKITSVKPSGSVSLLPGVSPGIHYPHARYYIRRIRLSSDSPLVEIMKKAGYSVTFSKYGAGEKERKRTSVIEFPVHEKHFSRKKSDITIWEQVKNCIDYQTYWADNNVSITVTFKKNEESEIPHLLEAYEDKLKAISLLPLEENGYEQMPYEEITKKEFEKMCSAISPIDFTSLTNVPEGENFCDGDNCNI